MSGTNKGKQRNIYFYHHHALQGISSAIAHIERFSVYRKSREGFISTCVSTRNKALLRLKGFLHALRLVEMTIYFYHRNFTSGETSLVIDKLHFP